MFFVLSKTVAFLILPSNFLILFGLAGLVLMTTRWRRLGGRMTMASLVVLALIGFSPLGGLLTHVLEDRFPPWNPARGAPVGIVILGGEISPVLSRERGEPAVSGVGARIVAMAKLARTYPDARIVYSGGDASLLGNQPPESNYVYPSLDSLGIARDRVILETRSRNTAENATFTKNLVKPKSDERWLLVTSSQHMPRAIGCFRGVDFPVEAYPVGWLTGTDVNVGPSLAFSSGLAQFDSAAREWIGLLAYWLTGKTNEFLPGPR